jgi:hypothetical protein
MFTGTDPLKNVLVYQVIKDNIVVFEDPCYSKCNGFIFRAGAWLMGIRPKPYLDEN